MNIVYRYGILPPTLNADVVADQMHHGHRYRNTLVELEHKRRAEMREAFSSLTDLEDLEKVYRAAESDVEALTAKVKRAKAAGRTAKVSADVREALKLARVRASDARKTWQTRKKAASVHLTSKFREADGRDNERIKAARADTKAYWGTYLLVENAHKQMREDMPLYRGLDPNDPRFVRWAGHGMVGVQIQKGISVEEVLGGTDERLRIVPNVRPGKKGDPSKSFTLWMRVASTDKRKPVWATFPMKMHRPLPEGAQITWAKVVRKRIGPPARPGGTQSGIEEWSVHFTLRVPDVGLVPKERGTIAIDIGWRKRETGLRVAMWRDDEGRGGELVLPERVFSGIEKADELQSVRDREFDVVRARLVSWLSGREAPEWLTEATKTLSQWRSVARLERLVVQWSRSRFDGDDEIYETLRAWQYHDRHLWLWQENQRKQAERRRRDIYRCFAAWVAKTYSSIAVEDFDIRDVSRRPLPEDQAENARARRQRTLAAVGDLRSTIETAAKKYGSFFAKMPCADTTRKCHYCGSIEEWDQAAEVEHTCSGCAEHWDQDDNSAWNLLALWRERGDDLRKAEVARVAEKSSDPNASESRWARAKRLKRERQSAEDG